MASCQSAFSEGFSVMPPPLAIVTPLPAQHRMCGPWFLFILLFQFVKMKSWARMQVNLLRCARDFLERVSLQPHSKSGWGARSTKKVPWERQLGMGQFCQWCLNSDPAWKSQLCHSATGSISPHLKGTVVIRWASRPHRARNTLVPHTLSHKSPPKLAGEKIRSFRSLPGFH